MHYFDPSRERLPNGVALAAWGSALPEIQLEPAACGAWTVNLMLPFRERGAFAWYADTFDSLETLGAFLEAFRADPEATIQQHFPEFRPPSLDTRRFADTSKQSNPAPPVALSLEDLGL